VNTSFHGKTALVTAASEGLGFAAAKKLAAAGARVAICSRDPAKLGKARQAIAQWHGENSAIAIQADLTRAQDIESLMVEAMDRLGKIDILVVNTGHMPYGSVVDLDDAAWYGSFELILMSAVRLARPVVRHMQSRKTGDIIFITSTGTRDSTPHLVLSNVFRSGVMSFAKTLSHAVAGDGIRVSVLAPGYFDTGRVKQRIDELSVQEGLPRAEAARRITGAPAVPATPKSSQPWWPSSPAAKWPS
jgi:3-oxoacyl-[acyl-carrier protein] reductase